MAKHTFDPQHGTPVAVAPGIARVTAPNTGPFTGAGTNTYLLGERSLIVIDPGPKDAAHHRALLTAIAGRPVSHILLTHTHRDHVDGVADLVAATGATTVGEGPYRNARPLKVGEENPFLYASDTDFAPDERVGDGAVVDNGEVRVDVIATPGHNANHLAFALGDIAFSGDHVMGWSTTVIAPPDGAMADYFASLDRLLGVHHTRYLPGHGDAIADPHAAVSAMKSHRLMREAAILERVAAGTRTIPAIVDALYAGLDPALKGAAALSVLAHLEKLEADGAVAADGHGREATWRPMERSPRPA